MNAPRQLRVLIAALAVAVLPALAAEQAWPSKTIRVIVPFSIGSSIDIIGRVVTDPLATQLGQTMVVENRGGAGGTIGSNVVAKADPDGYMLLIHASAHSAAPAAYPGAPYDTAKDFSAVTVFGVVPNLLIISPKKGIKTLPELIAAAKKGSISFASAGVGSASHWAVERILIAGGVRAVHVPFKGGPEGILEVSTGRVDIMSPGVSSAMPFIKEGRLIPLAVSSRKRSATLPDVPTTLEAGLVDADYTYWMGMLAPAKTPRPVVERLHREVEKVLALPNVKERFVQLGVEPMPMSPAEFDALIRKEIEINIGIVKAANLKFD
jgi:tripartite-type tricarboxylate transporter receptor subunit TctC